MTDKPTYEKLEQRVKELELEVAYHKQIEEQFRRSEALLNTTQQLAKIGGWEIDLENKTTFWTDELYKIHDLQPDRFTSIDKKDNDRAKQLSPNDFTAIDEAIKLSEQCYNPEDRQKLMDAFKKCEEKAKGYNFELPFTTVKGYRKWVRTITHPVLDADKVVKIRGFLQDITKRKQAEGALKESEFLFSQMFKQSNTSTCLYNPEGTLIRVNPEFCTMFGVEEEIITDGRYNVFEDQAAKVSGIIPLLKKIFVEKKANKWEFSFNIEAASTSTGTPTSQKGEIFLKVYGYPVIGSEGEMKFVVLQHYDITKRKQAEEAQRESETKYKIITENASEGIIVYQDDVIKYVNPFVSEVLGYPITELLNRSFSDFIHPDDLANVNRRHQERIIGSKLERITTFQVITKSHETRWAQNNPVLIEWEGRPATLNFISDITDRKRAEEQQRESEEKFRLISEQSLLGISIFQDGVYKYVNDAISKISEYSIEEMMGWDKEEFTKLIHPDDLDYVMAQYRKKQVGEEGYITNYSYRGVAKSGKVKWIEQYSKPINYNGQIADLVTAIDITERKQTEELMIQTEKMMSVGGLAAGMAHELNNPLGGMLHGIQNIQRRLSPDLQSNLEPAEEFGIDLHNLKLYMEKRNILFSFRGIKASGEKASKIISNMLQFSRKSDSELVSTNLVGLIENSLELVGKSYNLKKKLDFKKINILKEFNSEISLVPCAEMEIEQVILNLLNNAAWAMANKKMKSPPQIILRTNVEKNMLRIEVEDNGPGMDEAVRKRIFEPFFTTKPVGEGTGLGLSVSYMIITNNHKGTMEVESELGKGTKFIIRLPMK
jgi:PAS domain S-box-containing protein